MFVISVSPYIKTLNNVMKKLISPALLLLSTMILLQACQREVGFDQDQDEPAVTGDFRAKIDGVQWVADSAAAASIMAGRIGISGLSKSKKDLTISLEDRGVGTYILNDTAFSAGAYVEWTLASPFAFTTNQGIPETDLTNKVVITSIDQANKRISGTFSFITHRQMDGTQRTFTEGVFTNLKYSTTLPPASTTDTFRVKIAGSSWTPASITGIKIAVPGMPGQLGISASDATGSKGVGFFLPDNITPGSYTLDLFGGTYIGQYNPDNDPAHSQGSVSGTLTVLEHNTTTKRIRANFNFRGETILPPVIATDLTEGYFSIKYQ